MKNILRLLSWQKIVFLVVLGIVIFQNRISGNQYLSGWDNLQPEINFGLELSRQLSAVWQEFRGLGHLGGMSHAADLPRTLILWLISWVVPTNFLRWGWHIGMLALGSIGIWYMGRKIWKWSESASFTASMFYLLNMATVQYFYTPYEAFSAFYGFLPWLISSYILYLENGTKKEVLRLVIVSLAATTAFYVQTLFVVYTMVLFIISLGYLKQWRRVLTAGIIVFVANAFWLLPVIYFVISNAGVVGVSKINSIASPETAYMNEAMGGWRDVLSMKGFWLEYVEWQRSVWGRLLNVWQEWLSSNVVQILSLSIAGLSIVGMMMGGIKKRISWWVSTVFILTFVMLASNNPPFGFAYTYLTEKIPFFGEMFRSVFTKWSVVMGMMVALGLGAMVEFTRTKKWLATILMLLIVGMAGYIVWPVFGGNLIFQSMKVEYPSEYSQLYKFFDGQDKSERIAYLPSAWTWGWQYHDWGYRGSGFLWYGIEQPILDRAFDVWSGYNEGFYDEFSNALYGCKSNSQIINSQILKLNCGEQVAKVLQKYDVKYVLLDESVIAPGQDFQILRIPETKALMQELGAKQVWQENFLTVWDLSQSQIINSQILKSGSHFISSPSSYTWVDADTNKVRKDMVWDQVGTYVTTDRKTGIPENRNTIYYPFASLMKEESKNVVWEQGGLSISSQGSNDLQRKELVIPGWKKGELVELGYSVRWEEGAIKVDWNPVYRLGDQLEGKLDRFDDLRGPSLPTFVYPIQTNLDSLWVQVEGSEAIYLQTGEEKAGRVKLAVGKPVVTKVYAGVGKEVVTKVGDEQKCGESGELRCWATPLAKVTRDSLFQTISHYEGEVSPEVCLNLEGEPYECVNTRKIGESPMVVKVAASRGEKYWVDWVARDQGTSMHGLGVVEYPLLERNEMGEEWWGEFLSERQFSLHTQELQRGMLKLSFPAQNGTRGNDLLTFDFATMGKNKIANCDVLGRGEAAKQITNPKPALPRGRFSNSQIEEQETAYIADYRGAACDYVEMNDIETSMSYLMRMQGENVAGRSLKFFLYNTGSKRNDIEWLMKSQGSQPVRSDLVGVNPTRSDLGNRTQGQFDQSFSLLPWKFDGNYSLNIETRSFGQRAENVVNPVEVRWFPLEQIAGARVVITNPKFSNSQIENELQIKEVKKTGTWLYRVGVESQITNSQMTNGGQGLIKLSQGYDEGWVGVQITNPKPALPRGRFSNSQILEHVKVDGWANGWMMGKSQISNDKFSNGEQKTQIIIFYWPQLLEYLGFGLMVLTLLWISKIKD